MNFLRRLLALLSALAADPAAVDTEVPRAAASVAVAAASLEKQKPREEEPAEPELVPVQPMAVQRRSGRLVYEGAQCYWVDEITGRRYRVVQ
jgi:hypothetical protein